MENAPRNYHLLVVSDLHVSEGRGARNKKFPENEDFFFDEEFARFLAFHQDARRWSGAKWHLVVNGDLFDFLQVIETDDASAARSAVPESHDRGLPCGELETVRKLRKIAEGHWLLFEALSGFVASGNVLTVIKGNHDVEFHYPGVREAFRDELRSAFRRRIDRDPAWGTGKEIERVGVDAVRFSDWFHYERDLLWIEHGNRYEGFNSFKYWLSPLLPGIPGWPPGRRDEIDLPFGSLFVRYLFNKVETVEPFADNIKPASRFVRWLIRNHPVTALGFLFTDGWRMLDRIRRAWADVSPEAWEIRRRQHEDRLRELAGRSGIEPATLKELDNLRARSLLKEPGGREKVLRFVLRPWIFLPAVALAALAVLLSVLYASAIILGPVIPGTVRAILLDPFVRLVRTVAPWAALAVMLAAFVVILRWLLTEEEGRGPSYLKDRAERIAERLDVRYVIMGHTHDAELHPIGMGGARENEYFNTGTWTTVFSEEERLLRKPVEFVFVQGVRKEGGMALRLFEWNDGAGEPRLLKLFRGIRQPLPRNRRDADGIAKSAEK